MPGYTVYVLKNPTGRLYIGLSGDVLHRLEQHNAGVSRWTATRGPWALFWQGPSMTLSEARKLENLLKRQKGGTGFYKLIGLPPPGSGS